MDWTEDSLQAFARCKNLFVSVAILMYADFGKLFILLTDASKRGLEAILYHD